MKILQVITAHEMARRFAIGEVNSSFCPCQDRGWKEETFRLLTSSDQALQREGILRELPSRSGFVNSIPQDTQWNVATFILAEDEFSQLRTINDPGWKGYTGGTLRLIDAATYLQNNPGKDPRVDRIVIACREGRLEMRGITLLAQKDGGPFTIVEGTARLVALYLCCVRNGAAAIYRDEIEVVLGISPTGWGFS